MYELADKFNFKQLRNALDRRLAQPASDPLLQQDLFGWVALADRHNLTTLRSHCVQLLLLQLSPSTTGPQHVKSLNWEHADKLLVMQLLDGMLSCMHKMQSRPAFSVAHGSRHTECIPDAVKSALPPEQKWAAWQRMGDAGDAATNAVSPTPVFGQQF